MKNILPVSLILTTLNEADTVEAFFATIAEGTLLPAEIVVCDGGSADGTAAVLRSQSLPGVSIRIIEEPGATIAKGRNTAIRVCSFDVLGISDAGCAIDPHWLDRITAPMLSDATVDAVSGGYVIDGPLPFQRCAAAAEIPVHQRPAETFLPSSRSFGVRKAAFLEAGGYPEHLSFAGEDTALCLEMRRRGKKFALALDAVVTWAPRATFGSFVKQHWLYGVGDGESGSNGRKYAVSAIKASMMLACCILGVVNPLFLFLLPAGAAAYFMHLYPKYGWQEQPLSTALCAFFLVLAKDAAMFAGYVKGALMKPNGREQA